MFKLSSKHNIWRYFSFPFWACGPLWVEEVTCTQHGINKKKLIYETNYNNGQL